MHYHGFGTELSDKKIGRILRKKLQRIWNNRFIKKSLQKALFVFYFFLFVSVVKGRNFKIVWSSQKKAL